MCTRSIEPLLDSIVDQFPPWWQTMTMSSCPVPVRKESDAILSINDVDEAISLFWNERDGSMNIYEDKMVLRDYQICTGNVHF